MRWLLGVFIAYVWFMVDLWKSVLGKFREGG
jgi:hypothetical protein